MEYVYVVTVSDRGADTGEFFREKACESVDAANEMAQECMNKHGGRDTFQNGVAPHPHVVYVWNSPRFSVWLERLVFEAAQ